MQIMTVKADGTTKFSQFSTLRKLKIEHERSNIVFFSEGDLFVVHDIKEDGYILATSARDEYLSVHFEQINRYIVIED